MGGVGGLVGVVLSVSVVAASCGGGHGSRAAAPVATTTTLATDLTPLAKGNFRLRGSLRTPLPTGAPGTVDVVSWAPRPTAKNTLPVVVRNNTATAVSAVEVTATVVVSGAAAGTGKSDGIAPGFVEPGQLAIGFVVLGSPVPDGATFTFSTTSMPTTEPYKMEIQDLFVVSATPSDGQIAGRLQNLFSDGVGGVAVTYICFDKSAVPTDAGRVGTTPLGMPQGYAAEFTAPIVAPCDAVLAAGSGRPNRVNQPPKSG